MTGRDYLTAARALAAGSAEAFWRAAVGRAYYALMLEARDLLRSWNIVHLRGDNVHTFVRLRMTYAADPDLHDVGLLLDALSQARNRADYDLSPHPLFASAAFAGQSVLDVAQRVGLLDAVAADPARSSAAVADIRARWP